MSEIQDALEQAEIERQQFAELVERMRDFACLITLQGVPFYVNRAGRRMVGLESLEQLSAASLRQWHPPETWHLLCRVALPTVQRTGHWIGAGQVNHLKTNSVLEVEIKLLVIRHPSKETPLCLAMLLRETGTHRRIERALRDTEALYGSLVENLPLNVLRKDLNGRFTFGNQRYCDTVGCTLDEILGKTDLDFFPRELADKYRRDDQRVVESGEAYETIEKHETPDGQTHYVQVWKTPVHDAAGKIVGTQAIFWDVTDHQQAEVALEESEARKAAILESALDAIITVDQEGNICEFNRAAERMFERPRAQVLGRDPADVLFPSDKREGHHNRIDRYMSEGSGSMLGRRMEVTAMRSNGSTFPAEMAMTINRMKGQPVFTFFLRDISVRKQAEEARARHAAELARSNSELQQFAFAASHDLQEPLRKVQAFGDRLKATCGDALSEQGQLYLERMQSAADRMQALIRGLLELSRVTTKGRQFESVDLAEVAQQVISDLEVRIEQLQGRVEIGPLPTIDADPLQMRQLLQNLIGNGLKFHAPGETPRVDVTAEIADGKANHAQPICTLTVRDHGIGFEEQQLEKIFAVFQRLHSRDEYEGVGLGLAICRKIAERHGGHITARSTPGEGASFIVTMPALHQNDERDN